MGQLRDSARSADLVQRVLQAGDSLHRLRCGILGTGLDGIEVLGDDGGLLLRRGLVLLTGVRPSIADVIQIILRLLAEALIQPLQHLHSRTRLVGQRLATEALR
ncbi:hypothetical protein D3C81_1552700 [compost metagenome]